MSKKEPKNVRASILQRLKNHSKEKNEDRGLIISQYAIERFLYRLSKSEYADQFVLKGAQLFCLWTHTPYRPTRDLDLLRYGSSDIPELVEIFQGICTISIGIEDGIEFLYETVRGEVIRDQTDYSGVRMKLEFRIGKTGQFMQIDVGFGDAITPPASEVQFPSILGMPEARLKSYPRETVIAEKVEAMVSLGIANSRMKDFFDIYQLSKGFNFDGICLTEAIIATFERRGTRIPDFLPTALTDEFSTDSTKQKQWAAFLSQINLADSAPDLSNIIHILKAFLIEPLLAAANRQTFKKLWEPGGPWA